LIGMKGKALMSMPSNLNLKLPPSIYGTKDTYSNTFPDIKHVLCKAAAIKWCLTQMLGCLRITPSIGVCIYIHNYDILGARMLWKPKEARILTNFIDQPV
jgi:hypothetical protein